MGQFTHSLDDKGRVSLPARFRNGEAGQCFVATRGIGGECLFLYPFPEWEKVVERLERQKARVDPRQRRLYLQMMQNTVETPVDGQGRISTPQRLLELVGIEGEVTFVGAGEVIEMWNPERYANYVAGSGEELDGWLLRYL
ncbi:MAG: division/cell wall cluster transcriptional repressor MraZ [Gemmatimonadota bacterium]